jgi:lipoprotein-anchoring transpeptidase ErfK/SrfK
MPFMMRLTMDGVAIHGATVENDAATHGCIGIPLEFAELVFGAAKKGDRVIVISGTADRTA